MREIEHDGMSLTEISERYKIPFPTLASWRQSLAAIEPDIKREGVSKKLFSPRQTAKILATRRLFKYRLHGKVVNAFLKQVMDGCDEDMEGYEDGSLFLKETKPEHEPILRITWLIAYDVDHPEDPYFIPSEPIETPDGSVGAKTTEEFSQLVDQVIEAHPQWRWDVLTLGSINAEVWGKPDAYRNCVERRPKRPIGADVARALANFRMNQS